MVQSNERHWEGSVYPRVAARILEVLAVLVGGCGLLVGLLLPAEEDQRTRGLLIGAAAVGATAFLSCGAVFLRWLSAAYELAARRLEPRVPKEQRA